MPAILHFSNSAGLLLDQLAATVGQGNPFEAPRIATPTPAMRRMVQMGLSERWGAAAHIDFLMLEGALWDCLARLDEHRLTPERQPARLLDASALQGLIFAQLLHAPPDAAAEYLQGLSGHAEKHQSPPAAWRKALQLAARLAHLFREYEYSRVSENGRQGLAALWLHGKPCFAQYLDKSAPAATRERVAALEAWQGELYRSIFGLGGLRDRMGEATGQYLYTLPQYREMVFAQERKQDSTLDPTGLPIHNPIDELNQRPVLHLFGLAHVSPFHRSLIQQLADEEATGGQAVLFRIFALNPCAEYWEDAIDPRTRRQRLQQSLLRQEKFTAWRRLSDAEKQRMSLQREVLWKESLDALDDDNALLARWGMVGRENIQLWCQITDYDFAGRFREPTGATLLAALQRSVLHRRGPAGGAAGEETNAEAEERLPQDNSFRLIAAPEKHREIEAMQSDMWRRFQADPSLRPDDIAIALIDAESYGPVIDMVLGARQGGEAGHIPYACPEAGTMGSDPYRRGLMTLLRVVAGTWDRPALLALLENPRAQAAMGFEPSTAGAAAEALVKTLNALNLYAAEGFGHGDGPDPHAFGTGLDRLLLGLWMEPPDPYESGAFSGRSFAGYLPHASPDVDDQALARFIAWMRRMETALRPFTESGQMLGLKPWAEAFIILADTALKPDQTGAGEARLRRNLSDLAESWEWRDKIMAIASPPPTATAEAATHEAPCPKNLFLESLRDALDGAEMAGPPWLSGGVQVGSLESLRGLPFRVIYVPGLQEGDFPDESLQSSLDLRQFRRVIGDLEPASRNRYALLMALMQATDAAVLSYVDRDLERNQMRQPSSVWGELVQTLERDHLKGDIGKPARFGITQVTLDEPEPSRVASAATVVEETAETAATTTTASVSLPFSQAQPNGALPNLDSDALLFFLKNPQGQSLKWSMGLSRRVEYEPETHEPYALAPGMLRRVGLDILAGLACEAKAKPLQEGADSRIEAALDHLRLRGDLPPGVFGERALSAAETALKAWFALLAATLAEDWGDAEARALTGVRFGSAWPQDLLLPRIDLAAPIFQGTTLSGYQGFVFARRSGGYGLLMTSFGHSPTAWTDFLPAFVFGILAARDTTAFGERFRSAPLEILAIPAPQPGRASTGGRLKRFRLTLTTELADSWLGAIWPYLTRPAGSPMPPALKAWSEWAGFNPNAWPWNQGSETHESFRRQVLQREEKARFETPAALSPLDEVTALLPPPPAADPLAWAERVFGPMLSNLEAVDKPRRSKSAEAA